MKKGVKKKERLLRFQQKLEFNGLPPSRIVMEEEMQTPKLSSDKADLHRRNLEEEYDK